MFYLYTASYKWFNVSPNRCDDDGFFLDLDVEIKQWELVATFSSQEKAESYVEKHLSSLAEYKIDEVPHDPE